MIPIDALWSYVLFNLGRYFDTVWQRRVGQGCYNMIVLHNETFNDEHIKPYVNEYYKHKCSGL